MSYRIFNRTYDAGDPKLEKRLQRVVPLIAAQVEKIYRRKGGRAMDAEEEEALQTDVLELIKEGRLCEKDLYTLAAALKERHLASDSASLFSGRESVVSNMSDLQRLLDGVETASTFTPAPPSPTERHGALPLYMQRKRVLAKDTWSMVVDADYNEHLQEEEAYKKSQVEKRRAQREALDEQVRAQRVQAAQAKRDAHDEYVGIMQQVSDYEAEERRKQAKLRAINMHLKGEREKQLEERAALREKERKEKWEEDMRLFETAKREEEAELARIRQRRADAIERVKRNAFYNQKQKAVKEQEMAVAAVEDQRLAKEYAEILERQEVARKKLLEDLAVRAAKQKEMGDRIGQSMDEKAAEDERRALLANERHEKKLRDEEAARMQRAEQSKQTRNRFIQRQIVHIKEEKERERVRGLMEKQRIHADIQAAEAEQRQETMAARQRNRAHLEDVKRQIRERQDQVLESMSAQEKAFNRKILHKVPLNKRLGADDGGGAAFACPHPPSAPPPPTCPAPVARDTTPFLPPSLPSSRAVSCTPCL